MTKKQPLFSLFESTFIGESVRIITNKEITESIQSEEEIKDITSSMVLYGVLLDKDDMYYYLGNSPEEVSQAIKISDVSIIQIEEIVDEFTEILDNMPNPSRKEEIN